MERTMKTLFSKRNQEYILQRKLPDVPDDSDDSMGAEEEEKEEEEEDHENEMGISSKRFQELADRDNSKPMTEVDIRYEKFMLERLADTTKVNVIHKNTEFSRRRTIDSGVDDRQATWHEINRFKKVRSERADAVKKLSVSKIKPSVTEGDDPEGYRVSRNPFYGFGKNFPLSYDMIVVMATSADYKPEAVNLGDFDHGVRGSACNMMVGMMMRVCERVSTPPDEKVVRRQAREMERRQKEIDRKRKAEEREQQRARDKREKAKLLERRMKEREEEAKFRRQMMMEREGHRQKIAEERLIMVKNGTSRPSKKMKVGDDEGESEYSSSGIDDEEKEEKEEKEDGNAMLVDSAGSEEGSAEETNSSASSSSSSSSDEEDEEEKEEKEEYDDTAEVGRKRMRTSSSESELSESSVLSESSGEDEEMEVEENNHKKFRPRPGVLKKVSEGSDVDIEDEPDAELAAELAEFLELKNRQEPALPGFDSDGFAKLEEGVWTYKVPGTDASVSKVSFIIETVVARVSGARLVPLGTRFYLVSHDPSIDLNNEISKVLVENAKMVRSEREKAAKNPKYRAKGFALSSNGTLHRKITSKNELLRSVLGPLARLPASEVADAEKDPRLLTDRTNPYSPTALLSILHASHDRVLTSRHPILAQVDIGNYVPKDVLEDFGDGAADRDVPITGKLVFPYPALTFLLHPHEINSQRMFQGPLPRTSAYARALRYGTFDGSEVRGNAAMSNENIMAEFYMDADDIPQGEEEGEDGARQGDHKDLGFNDVGGQHSAEKQKSLYEKMESRSIVLVLAKANERRRQQIESIYPIGTENHKKEMDFFYDEAITRALEDFAKPSTKKLMSGAQIAVQAFLRRTSTLWPVMPHVCADRKFRSDSQFGVILLDLITDLFDLRSGKMQRDTLLILISAWNACWHSWSIHFNMFDHGKASAGKSTKLDAVCALLVDGTFNSVTGLTTHAWEISTDLNYYWWCFHEVGPDKFGIDPKSGFAMTGGNEVLKSKLTENIVRTFECNYVKKPGENDAEDGEEPEKFRMQVQSISSQIGSMACAANFNVPTSLTGSEEEQLAAFSRFCHVAASMMFETTVSTLDAALQTLEKGRTLAQQRMIHLFRLLHCYIFMTEMMIGSKAMPDVNVDLATHWVRDLNRKMKAETSQTIAPRLGLMFITACRTMCIASVCWQVMLSEFNNRVRFTQQNQEVTQMNTAIFKEISKRLSVTEDQVTMVATLMEDMLIPVLRSIILTHVCKILKSQPVMHHPILTPANARNDAVYDTNYYVVSENGLAALAKQINEAVGDGAPFQRIHEELHCMLRQTSLSISDDGSGHQRVPSIRLDDRATQRRGRPSVVCFAVKLIDKYLGVDERVVAAFGEGFEDPAEFETPAEDEKKKSSSSGQLTEENIFEDPDYDSAFKAAPEGHNVPLAKCLATNLVAIGIHLKGEQTEQSITRILGNVFAMKRELRGHKTLDKNVRENLSRYVEMGIDLAEMNVDFDEPKEVEFFRSGMLDVCSKLLLYFKEFFGSKYWADECTKFNMGSDKIMVPVGAAATPATYSTHFEQALESGNACADPAMEYERNTFLVKHIREYFSHNGADDHDMLDMGPLITPHHNFQRYGAIIRVRRKQQMTVITRPMPTSHLSMLIYANTLGRVPCDDDLDNGPVVINCDTSDFFRRRYISKNGLYMDMTTFPSQQMDTLLKEHARMEPAARYRMLAEYPRSIVEMESKRMRKTGKCLKLIDEIRNGSVPFEDRRSLKLWNKSIEDGNRLTESLITIEAANVPDSRLIAAMHAPFGRNSEKLDAALHDHLALMRMSTVTSSDLFNSMVEEDRVKELALRRRLAYPMENERAQRPDGRAGRR